MKGYQPSSYGDAMADIYDSWYGIRGTDETVDRLVRMAPAGASVLELGSGTGRLAIPMSQAGLDVTVIEASSRMIEEMRSRPGGSRIVSHRLDMSEFVLDGADFDVVVCAYHTFFQLPTLDAQRSCLRSIARHLRSDGKLVLEAFIAPPGTASDGVEVWRVDADRVVLSASRIAPDTGAVEGQVIDISEAGIKLRPWRVLYQEPAELDELAASCGLELTTRWGGWDESPFGEQSQRHISTYQLAR